VNRFSPASAKDYTFRVLDRLHDLFRAVTSRIILPGFEGLPLYDVLRFFYRGIAGGYITSRASAIAFSFFLAIFPFLIFLFTIIPFIPIEDFQTTLLKVIADMMPRSAFESVRETIIDVVTRPRSGLLLFNLVLSLYFSSNGVNSLIQGFNNTYHQMDTRTTFRQYLVSLWLVLILSLLLIMAIGLMTFGGPLIRMALSGLEEYSLFYNLVLRFFQWFLIMGLLLLAISFLYYLAPARHSRFRFISAGSLLATLLIILATLGFNYYVDHFSQYNVLYGSIGTLLVVMMWIYLNALSLLTGFELNASIMTARSGGAATAAPGGRRGRPSPRRGGG